MGGGCPSDETLAAHVAGELDEAGAEAMRDHLDDCAICRELLLVLARGTPREQRPELAATVVAIGKLRAIPQKVNHRRMQVIVCWLRSLANARRVAVATSIG